MFSKSHIYSTESSSGARLIDTQGRGLPLRGTHLEVHAGAGLARVTLRQRFLNAHTVPLRVKYQLPLPADAAVAGFGFELDGVRTEGEVRSRKTARRDFERALLEGRSAALLEEDRSSLFQEEVGNIPPGTEVMVEVALDQPLAFLPKGAYSFRFPTVVGPRYLGGKGQTPDADRIRVALADAPIETRATLELYIEDTCLQPPHSPVHTLVSKGSGRFGFAEESGVPLDRDLVVEWWVSSREPKATLLTARPSENHAYAHNGFALLGLVPPKPEASFANEGVPRDLIFLIDVSGSMGGEPLNQAKQVLLALIESMGPQDHLEMVAFSRTPTRWRAGPTAMDGEGKMAARQWLGALSAGGGTEMLSGIEEALRTLREGTLRQVVVVTDGYIGFEAKILKRVLRTLPASCRVHTLGVGHAVNRSLTTPLARIGCGRELIVAPGENAPKLAERLLAATDRPQVTDLSVRGAVVQETAQRVLPDLYSGQPARIPLRVSPDGGSLEVFGHTASGPWSLVLEVPASPPGSGSMSVVTAFAREKVEDLEAERWAEDADQEGIDVRVEQLGIDFQISTRKTSWVAIREGEATVDPQDPMQVEEMPHELPAGFSAQAIRLRRSPSPEVVSDAALPDIAFSLPPMSPPPTPASQERMMSQPRPRAVLDSSLSTEDALDSELDIFADELQSVNEASIELEPVAYAPARSAPTVKRKGLPRGRRAKKDKNNIHLVAKLVFFEPGRVVLTIALEQDLQWPEFSTIEVTFEKGNKEMVKVETKLTTASRRMSAGQFVRLVLVAEAVPMTCQAQGICIEVQQG